MPSRLRGRIGTLQAAMVAVPRDRRGPVVDPDVLTAVAPACRAHERLRFDYTAHPGAATRREVEPYRLVNWGRRWYLLAWDLGRADWRTFRVDRLRPRVPTGPRFTPRDLPEEDVAERVTPAVGTVESVDDHTCVLHTGADAIETLAVYLGMLNADFHVADPLELVAHLRTLAARYTAATP
ncbi:helix-turn-helix transcriptional regulator [Actinoallomurus sp. CA-142502]|uniref:helix-turn-helix transcriptional regulator n=1 Tax=Actinoallomurus sp. CA-142502 TaxID=3239885 RepID=UPI003D9263C8